MFVVKLVDARGVGDDRCRHTGCLMTLFTYTSLHVQYTNVRLDH